MAERRGPPYSQIRPPPRLARRAVAGRTAPLHERSCLVPRRAEELGVSTAPRVTRRHMVPRGENEGRVGVGVGCFPY